MSRPRPDQTTLDPQAPFAQAPSGDRRLLAIYEIGRQLLEQHQPEEVLRTILAAIVEHLGPDHAAVLGLEGEKAYRPLATHNLDLQGPAEEWPLSRTVLERARQTGMAVLGVDLPRDLQLGAVPSVQRLQIQSVMCVPLGRAPVEGIIYVDSRNDRRAFTGEDLAFLTAISLYTSLVLDRARDLLRATEALRLTDERLSVLQGELLRYQIVGRAPALLAAYDTVKRFARGGARVVLRGETGTGKELFARAYAANSARAGRPYVPVPIPALAPTLVESELFGHVKGAFTEAAHDKKGRLELAHGGVLFLDEVGDIEPALQAKLLRFLDSGELFRVGDTVGRRVDALVVSATNRPIEAQGAAFRTDLLARLGHVVVLPPLRERPEDVPLLVEHFLEGYGRGGRAKTFAPATLRLMQAYRWPLNVRELQHTVERVVCLVDREVIEPEDLPEEIRRPADPAMAATGRGSRPLQAGPPRPLRAVIEEAEKNHILRALEFTQGNRRRAIELLQISPDTFYKRLEEFGLRSSKKG